MEQLLEVLTFEMRGNTVDTSENEQTGNVYKNKFNDWNAYKILYNAKTKIYEKNNNK